MAIIPWEQVNENILNIADVLQDLLNTSEEKDVPWLTIDADGNAVDITIPNLAKLLNTQKIELSDTFLQKLSADDLEFTDSNKGVITIDRTTGDKVRLYVDNGEIKTEVV